MLPCDRAIIVAVDKVTNVTRAWPMSRHTDDLYEAIRTDDADRVQGLLATTCSMADCNDEAPPPVHWAILHDRPRITEILLDHGADLEAKDSDRHATPLDYAIVYGRKDIIPILVARGADLTGKLPVAEKGASGEFEEYKELPSRQAYQEILDLLRGLIACA